MNRIQMALAALLFTTSVTIAQPSPKTDKGPHGPRREVAYDKLDLTDDQKAKMKASDDDFRKQLQALNNNENQTVKQQREARAQLIRQHQAQMDNILTADQKAQLKERKAEGKAQRGEMGTWHLDRMKQDLSLTDQQVAQLKSSQDALQGKIEAIRNNSSLSESVKREQLHSLHEEQRKNMEQVLTSEQKAKWWGMMKDRHHGPRTKRGDSKATAPQA